MKLFLMVVSVWIQRGLQNFLKAGYPISVILVQKSLQCSAYHKQYLLSCLITQRMSTLYIGWPVMFFPDPKFYDFT